jgi:hypothetical protein
MAFPPPPPPPPPPPNNQQLGHRVHLILDPHHHTVIVWMWVEITQRLLGNVVNVSNNLEWVGKLSRIILLNNDLLIMRHRRWLLNNLCQMACHQMRDTVEPRFIPRSSLSQIPCHPTPINQLYDMDHIISEGLDYLLWIKRCHVRMRSGMPCTRPYCLITLFD